MISKSTLFDSVTQIMFPPFDSVTQIMFHRFKENGRRICFVSLRREFKKRELQILFPWVSVGGLKDLSSSDFRLF